jgi:hypothetical protein
VGKTGPMRAPLDFLVVVKDTLRVKLADTSWAGRVGAVVVVGCLVVGGALVALNGSGADRAGDALRPGPGQGGPSAGDGSDAGGREPDDDAVTALNRGVGRERPTGGEVTAGGNGVEGTGADMGAPVAEAATLPDGSGDPPAGAGQDGAAAGGAEVPGREDASPPAPTSSSTSTPPTTSPSVSTTTTTTASSSTTTTAPSDGGGGGLLGGLLGLLLGHG